MGGLSFCRDANQSLQVAGKVLQCDMELDETMAYLQNCGLLKRDTCFASRMELVEFLLCKQEKFKQGLEAFNEKQAMVLDQELYDTLGRRLYT